MACEGRMAASVERGVSGWVAEQLAADTLDGVARSEQGVNGHFCLYHKTP